MFKLEQLFLGNFIELSVKKIFVFKSVGRSNQRISGREGLKGTEKLEINMKKERDK